MSVTKWKVKEVNVRPLEVQCDICTVTFDDPLEIQEFVMFDYKTGPGSIIADGIDVKFAVCQDCLLDAFPDYFDALIEELKENEEVEELLLEELETGEWENQSNTDNIELGI